MPPIVKTFKAPDGKEFNTKSEWRDYMMTEYYSFKNKANESLIKLPGTIDGQGFDIADCENSTLVVLDHSEQVCTVTAIYVYVLLCTVLLCDMYWYVLKFTDIY
jgi:hypothetical protein